MSGDYKAYYAKSGFNDKSHDRSGITVFRGIDRHKRTTEGTFRDDYNLTSSEYPVLQTRPPRGWLRFLNGEDELIHRTDGAITAMCEIDGQITFGTSEGLIVRNGVSTGTDSYGRGTEAIRQLIPIGRQVYVLPQGILITDETEPPEYTYQHIEGGVAVSIAESDGNELIYAEGYETVPYPAEVGTYAYDDGDGAVYRFAESEQWIPVTEPITSFLIGMDTAPSSPIDGMKWADKSERNGFYVYSAEDADWTAISDITIVLETGENAFGAFDVNDAVEIAGTGVYHLDGVHAVLSKADDGSRITVDGIVDAAETGTYEDMTVTRRMPVIDHAVEHNNRIWGCRYGENDRGDFVNEIYCSAQGTPHHWLTGRGLVEDPVTFSVGAAGRFTGAAVLSDNVVFFKEKCFFTVYGDYGADFVVKKTDAPGVQRGCENSLCAIGDSIIYKSDRGIMMMNAQSLPVCVSEALGEDIWSEAVAGTDGRRYYVDMLNEKTGKREMYVYDTNNAIWHREDHIKKLTMFAKLGSSLMAIESEKVSDTLNGNLIPRYPYIAQTLLTKPLHDFLKKAWDGITERDEDEKIVAKSDQDIQLWIETQTEPVPEEYATPALLKAITFLTLPESYHENRFNLMNEYTARGYNIPDPIGIYSSGVGWQTGISAKILLMREFREPWYAETGLIGLNDPAAKRVNMIDIRATVGAGSSLTVMIDYDDEDDWKTLREITTDVTGTFRIFGEVSDCDVYRLRLRGWGEVTVYSIVPVEEYGGDRTI